MVLMYSERRGSPDSDRTYITARWACNADQDGSKGITDAERSIGRSGSGSRPLMHIKKLLQRYVEGAHACHSPKPGSYHCKCEVCFPYKGTFS